MMQGRGVAIAHLTLQLLLLGGASSAAVRHREQPYPHILQQPLQALREMQRNVKDT